MTHREVGKTIAKKRKQMGMTQEALASQIGLKVSQLKFLEGGRKNITPQLLQKIETILGPVEPSDSQAA